MSHRTTLLALLLSSTVALALFQPMASSADTTAPATPAVTEAADAPTETTSEELAPFGIHGGDEASEAAVLDAIAVFEEADMDLPPLRIFVHADHEPCFGNLGLFSKGGDLNRIDLCNTDHELIVHELAHAWERHNIDQSVRDDFVAHTGATNWNDHDIAHPARGVEQAAKAIAWGLIGSEIPEAWAGGHDVELHRFEMLTGRTSPRLVAAVAVELDIDVDELAGDVQSDFG